MHGCTSADKFWALKSCGSSENNDHGLNSSSWVLFTPTHAVLLGTKQPGNVKLASTVCMGGKRKRGNNCFLEHSILTAIVFFGFTVFCIFSFSQLTALGPIGFSWGCQQHGYTAWIFAGSNCLKQSCLFLFIVSEQNLYSNHISESTSSYLVMEISWQPTEPVQIVIGLRVLV